jgi:hypothetical protein
MWVISASNCFRKASRVVPSTPAVELPGRARTRLAAASIHGLQCMRLYRLVNLWEGLSSAVHARVRCFWAIVARLIRPRSG